MEELLIETYMRIVISLEVIAATLVGIFLVQTLILFFKDNNGGFYLRQINETLKNIILKLK